MTNQLQKPGGYVDDADTVTGAQADGIDNGQARCVDGVDGGEYSPTAPILKINNAGLSTGNLRDTTIYAGSTLSRAATARWPRRVDTTTVLDQVATQHIGVQADKYKVPVSATNIISIELGNAGSPAGTLLPVAGDVVEFFREGVGLLVHFDGGSGNICSFRPALINMAHPLYWAKFIYDGVLWRVYAQCADSSI